MKAEPYLSINPMGKVPAIVHNGKVVTEVAAICCYLADAFPEAGLAPAAEANAPTITAGSSSPPARSRRRSATRRRVGSRRPSASAMFGYGNYDLAIDTLEKALDRHANISAGDRFTAADLFVGANVNFMLAVRTCSSRGRCSSTMRARMTDRDAYRRAKEIDDQLIAEMQAAG